MKPNLIKLLPVIVKAVISGKYDFTSAHSIRIFVFENDVDPDWIEISWGERK